MATVKLQNGKVILKDGKVSCSCCAEPGECCMYPAQALADGLYTADDLPDSVILNYDLVEDFELTRSGSEFIGGIYKIALGTLPNSTETQWLLYVNNERDNNNPCLITGDGGLTPGDDIVEDQFADTYTATITGDDSESVTVTRESLCVWRGIDANGSSVFLRYIVEADPGFPQPQFDYKWNLDFRGCSRFKASGFQNTPVGNYEICYQGESTCTIS